MGLFRKPCFMKKKKQLTKKKQQLFIQLLADLLGNGFTLQESFLFMKKSQAINSETIHFLTAELEIGSSLDELLKQLGFSQMIAVQVAFATSHGDLEHTLKEISRYLVHVQKYRQSFQKVLSYPLVLLSFLLIVIFSIRQLLLPQLTVNSEIKDNLGLTLIQNSPYLMGSCVLLSVCVYLAGKHYLQKLSPLQRSFLLMHVPLFRTLYQEYLSAFFALEWGKLFAQGLETKTVILLMKQAIAHPLMKAIATDFGDALLSGETLYQQLEKYPFFTKELSLIIQQGEVKGKLGTELMVYSKICFEHYFKKIEKIIFWIQPIVFLIIALLVVSVYGAMLLPIYGNMEEFL